MLSIKNSKIIDFSLSRLNYEQWLQKSLILFGEEIPKNISHFNDKDHLKVLKVKSDIYKIFLNIDNALIKSIQVYNLINIIKNEIMHFNPLHASSYILINKVKFCLDELKKIDVAYTKNASSQSKWFYELLQSHNTHSLIDPIINELDKRIKHYHLIVNQSIPSSQKPILRGL